MSASLDFSRERGAETRVAELFPEDIFNYVYTEIERSEITVRQLCQDISAGRINPADVVSLIGTMNIPGVQVEAYNPFDPPEIKIPKTYKIYGEICFPAEIENEGFKFPVYFIEESKEIVCYSNNKPVEVVGVLKWAPSYEVGGFAINQIMLAAALLLRR